MRGSSCEMPSYDVLSDVVLAADAVLHFLADDLKHAYTRVIRPAVVLYMQDSDSDGSGDDCYRCEV